MGLAGKDAKIQVKGTSASFTEITEVVSTDLSIEPEMYDVSGFSDEGIQRIKGIIDSGLDFEINTQASQGSGVTDLRDSALNGTAVEVELSPDGNTSGGPTDVFKFTGKVSTYEHSASVGSKQTNSGTIENSDGSKITIDSTFS